MIIDEQALAVLRSKYALPPCPDMARGRMCGCQPKAFTFKACVWQGYKESRDAFPPMAETLERLWRVMRAAKEFRESLNSYVQGCSVLSEEEVQRLDATLQSTFNSVDPSRNGDA